MNRLLVVFFVVLLASCASMQPSFEDPSVNITSFRVIPGDSLNPNFEIGLHIVNPNNIELALQGLAYKAKIEGHQILSGASNDLPIVAAYGEADVVVTAQADLFGGFRLLNDLLKQQRQQLAYQLNIKLDIGRFVPAINVEQSGQISLSGK
ncbi:MAG: LEA type 2 family protein [Oceanicoccus sp.]